MQPDNPVAVAGHNAPPEPTPYEAARERIETLYQQAADYLDGEPLATQGQADDVSKLMRMISEEIAVAEAARKAEKAPHDAIIKEIQDRWNLLVGDTKTVTGKAVLAVATCKKALAPWLQKLAAEQEAAAKAAREEAARKQHEAQEAMRAATADNLAARDAAEELARAAAAADRAARAAEKAKPHAGTYGRAAHLRTYHDATVTDGAAFHRWCVRNDRDAMTAYLARRAQELTDANIRRLPGVTVNDRREVA